VLGWVICWFLCCHGCALASCVRCVRCVRHQVVRIFYVPPVKRTEEAIAYATAFLQQHKHSLQFFRYLNKATIEGESRCCDTATTSFPHPSARLALHTGLWLHAQQAFAGSWLLQLTTPIEPCTTLGYVPYWWCLGGVWVVFGWSCVGCEHCDILRSMCIAAPVACVLFVVWP
jgi:hypothetical protein